MLDRLVWPPADRRDIGGMVVELETLAAYMTVDTEILNRAMGQIRDRRAIGGIELLDGLARRGLLKPEEFSGSNWHNAVGFALDRDPQGVSAWLMANPGSPVRTQVAEIHARRTEGAPE